jgi:hypothetical protein
MGYSAVQEVNVIVRGSGVYGLTMIGIGARRGSYEPHGPF